MYPDEQQVYSLFDSAFTSILPMKIIKNLSTSLDRYDNRKDISYLLNIKMRLNRGKVDMDVLRWFLRLFRDDVLLKLETHLMKDFLYVMHRIFDTNIREMKFSHFIEMFSETKKQRELLYSYAVNLCASLKETRLRNILNHVDVEKFSNYRLYLDIIESFLIKVKKSLYKIELGLVKKNKKENDIPEKEDSNDKNSSEKIEKEDQMQIHKITENSYVTDMSNYENDFRESSSEKIYINKNCDEYKNLEKKEKAREFAKIKNTSRLPTDQKFAKDKKEDQISMDRKFEDIVRNSKFLNEKKNEEYEKKQSLKNLENITANENSENHVQETYTIRKQDNFKNPEQSIDKKSFKKNENQKRIYKNANVAGNSAEKGKSAIEYENLGQNNAKQKTFLDEKYDEYMKDNGKQKTFLDEKYEEYLKSKEEEQIAKSKNIKEHTKAYVNSIDKTSKPSRSSSTKIFSSSTNNLVKDEKTMNEEDLIEEDFIEELRNFDLEGFIKKNRIERENLFKKLDIVYDISTFPFLSDQAKNEIKASAKQTELINENKSKPVEENKEKNSENLFEEKIDLDKMVAIPENKTKTFHEEKGQNEFLKPETELKMNIKKKKENFDFGPKLTTHFPNFSNGIPGLESFAFIDDIGSEVYDSDEAFKNWQMNHLERDSPMDYVNNRRNPRAIRRQN